MKIHKIGDTTEFKVEVTDSEVEGFKDIVRDMQPVNILNDLLEFKIADYISGIICRKFSEEHKIKDDETILLYVPSSTGMNNITLTSINGFVVYRIS